MTGERREEDGKTHRPIVPAGKQPKSRPLICRSNIREALGWLVGWLVGRRQRSAWREEDAEPKWSAQEIRKRWVGVGGRVGGLREGGRGKGANDTSLGNFNFAGITVGANKNKEIFAFFLRPSLTSPSLSSFSPLSPPPPLTGRVRYIVSHRRHYTTVSTTRVPNRVYV